MLTFLKEFCDDCSIHGIRFFTERQRHWSERLWWIFAVVLSIGLCGSSIRDIWINWNADPVKMSLSDKTMPISAIPFPSVTICPLTKSKKEKLDVTSVYLAWKENSRELTDDELILWEMVNHICAFNVKHFVAERHQFMPDTIYDAFRYMAPSFNDTFMDCMWQKESIPCDKIFSPIWTDEGLCYSLNGFNSREMYTNKVPTQLMTVKSNPNVSRWSLHNGYEIGTKGNIYPERAKKARFNSALYILLMSKKRDLDYICSFYQGYSVHLDVPGQTPTMLRQSFRASLDEFTTISIKPKVITTSDSLRSYTPKQRGCFFDYERHLQFFKIYTQVNCKEECFANFTNNQCGCVKFSMPREKSTKICGGKNIECYKTAARKLLKGDVVGGRADNLTKKFLDDCNCLPACTSITYDATADKERLNISAAFIDPNISLNDSNKSVSIILILYDEDNISVQQRIPLYTLTDFLAICGGLLGLFLGFSVLSIIEIIYYFSLRFVCTIRIRRQKIATSKIKPAPIDCVSINITED